MFNFAWNQVWWLLPLPLLIWWLLPAASPATTAVKLPFYDQVAVLGNFTERRTLWLNISLLSLAWFLLIFAAARPQLVGEQINIQTSGYDLILAVDVSASMKTADMKHHGRSESRLLAVKRVAADFIKQRQHDRIGLILFGTQAYLQTPLTLDRTTVNTLLQESQVGIAGEKTAIGDAIGLAIKRFDSSYNHQKETKKNKDKILLLLTDGANTAGTVPPKEAAQHAANQGLRIHTIGVGADQMQVRDIFGTRLINPSADLDEATLQQIAKTTGGKYFRARDVNTLQHIYRLIDQLEPIDQKQKNIRPVEELFYWPLSLAFLCAILLFVRIHALGTALSLSFHTND